MFAESIDRDGSLVQVGDGQVRIRGELTIQHAEDLKPLLLASLPTDGRLARLDLAAVSEIDTAGIQLLLAARREVANRGGALQIVAASHVVQEALSLLRQDGLLCAPAARDR